MKYLAKKTIFYGACLWLLAFLLPNVVFLDWLSLILATLVFVPAQLVIKPIMQLVFWPFNMVTFGLAAVLINAALLWLITFLVPGFTILPMQLFNLPLNQLATYAVTGLLLNIMVRLVAWL